MGVVGGVQLPQFSRTAKKLIEQAVGAAHGKPPPAELQLAWDCKRWGALLEGGGLLDQPYKTMTGMSMSISIYETIAYMKSLAGRDIHRLTDGQRRTIRWIQDQGINVLHG